VESDDPHLVLNTLKTQHANAFTAEALNALMLKFSANLTIFNVMLYKIGYAFPKDVLEKIWKSTRMPTVINESGERLGKSKQEIASQQSRFASKAMQKNESLKKSFMDRIESLFES